MIKLASLISESTGSFKYIGVCDKVRSLSDENEQNWHKMMANKKKISTKLFFASVNMRDILDDDENEKTWDSENRRADSASAPYKSIWGTKQCMFYQHAGFEFIFVKK